MGCCSWVPHASQLPHSATCQESRPGRASERLSELAAQYQVVDLRALCSDSAVGRPAHDFPAPKRARRGGQSDSRTIGRPTERGHGLRVQVTSTRCKQWIEPSSEIEPVMDGDDAVRVSTACPYPRTRPRVLVRLLPESTAIAFPKALDALLRGCWPDRLPEVARRTLTVTAAPTGCSAKG